MILHERRLSCHCSLFVYVARFVGHPRSRRWSSTLYCSNIDWPGLLVEWLDGAADRSSTHARLSSYIINNFFVGARSPIQILILASGIKETRSNGRPIVSKDVVRCGRGAALLKECLWPIQCNLRLLYNHDYYSTWLVHESEKLVDF